MNKEKLIRRRMQEAEKVLERGSINRAVLLYDHVIRLDPHHEKALIERFKCLFALNSPVELLTKADQLVESLPDTAEAWMCRALAYSHAREFEPAIESYRRCIDLEPDNFRAVHNLGSVLCENDHDDEGIPLLERAVSISPDYQIGQGTLLLKYYEKKRFDEAIKAGEHAPGILEQRPELRRVLGECYYATGKFTIAREIFSDVIHEFRGDEITRSMGTPVVDDTDGYDHAGTHGGGDEEYLKATYFRAVLSLQSVSAKDPGDIQAIESDLASVLSINPEHGYALAAMANIKRKEDKTDEAVSCIDKAIRLVPGDEELLRLKGLILMEKEPQAAHDLFDEVLKRKPAHAGALLGKALTLRSLGRNEEGVAAMKELSRKNPLLLQMILGALQEDDEEKSIRDT